MTLEQPYKTAAGDRKRRVPVLLPYPFPAPFDYLVPADLDPLPGDVVLVPLNRRDTVGVVWDGAPDPGLPDARLKPIGAVLEQPPMAPAMRRFVDWVAGYTLSPPGEVMAMALRVLADRPAAAPAGWQAADAVPDARLTEARRRVLAVLDDGRPRPT